MIPDAYLPELARRGLQVVTNPGFLHARGDRYLADVDHIADLYRVRSLLRAGIAVRAGSDAPYGQIDPWLGMPCARDRLSRSGAPIELSEGVTGRMALRLYCRGRISPGGVADLMLCQGSPQDILADLTAERVRMTMIGGRIVHGT